MNRPLSFIPGPAKISPAVYQDMTQAMHEGVLELSHRSDAFVEILDTSLQSLRSFLQIPDAYQIIYTDSASRTWHSLFANIQPRISTHIVTGAFSQKAAVVAEKVGTIFYRHTVDMQQETPAFPDYINPASELITICLSESSNGSAWSHQELNRLRTLAPHAIIAVDVTSCAGAIALDLSLADVWYFSVQKAFGLPAGLGVTLLSPTALARSKQVATDRTYSISSTYNWNDLVVNYQNRSGPYEYTPNMLGIYLLGKQAARFHAIGQVAINHTTQTRAQRFYAYLETHPVLSPYISNPHHRSSTVIVAQGDPDVIGRIHNDANIRHIRLGRGYGVLFDTTLRIGNFPSLTEEDIDQLLEWL